jgi:hypothetical protein
MFFIQLNISFYKIAYLNTLFYRVTFALNTNRKSFLKGIFCALFGCGGIIMGAKPVTVPSHLLASSALSVVSINISRKECECDEIVKKT